jgi:hypothetical protein
MAELFLDQHGIDGGQPPSAEFLRNVHGVETEVAGFPENRPGLFRRQHSRFLHLILKRLQLGSNETLNGVDEQTLFVGKSEVHKNLHAER